MQNGPEDLDEDGLRWQAPCDSKEDFTNILNLAAGLARVGAPHGAFAG